MTTVRKRVEDLEPQTGPKNRHGGFVGREPAAEELAGLEAGATIVLIPDNGRGDCSAATVSA